MSVNWEGEKGNLRRETIIFLAHLNVVLFF